MFTLTALKNFFYLSIFVLMLIAAAILQQHLFLNWDVAWLVIAAKRMLLGGTYTQDFVEINPPMIFFFYMPVLMLNKFLSLILAFRLYIFFLASISLFFCRRYLSTLFANEKRLAYWLFFIISMAFLILPFYEFGQREHLYILLTFPYFLTLANRLLNNNINLLDKIAVGVMAGLGFALKPYFVVTFVCLEIYYLLARKNNAAFLRIDNSVIVAILLLYIICCYHFFPDYFHFIIPFSSAAYYQGVGYHWQQLLLCVPCLFCLIPALLFCVYYAFNPYKLFTGLLLVALFSNLIFTFFLQHTFFYYHLLPAYSYAIITLAYLLFIFAKQKHSLIIYVATGILSAEIILLLLTSNVTNALLMTFLPWLLAIGLLFCFNIFLFAKSKVITLSINSLFCFSFFLFPFYYGLATYQFTLHYQQQLRPMQQFLQKNALHQSVVFYTSTMVIPYPAIVYAQALPATRFNYFWMLPGLIKKPSSSAYAFLLQAVAEDLLRYRPKFVIIDVSKQKPYITDSKFEYLPFFYQNPIFVRAWQSYHYLTTIALPSPFDNTHPEFAVYVRER